jgi:hypothetical protein
MIKAATVHCLLLALAGAGGITATARAQTAEQVIAKARAYLGGEAALNAVKSVHFVGTIESQASTPGDSKPVKSAIEIVFQKPYQQRIIRTSPTAIQSTGLDDYDGWQRTQDLKDANNWQLTLLQPDVIKNLRANTWENLNFFKGIETRGGGVAVDGLATFEGTKVIKLIFMHEPKIVFYRYFDVNSGRLVLTETNLGDRIREEGEIMVNGLRFPQKVTSIGKAKDASGRVVDVPVIIAFDKITLNEVFADDFFAVPPIKPPAEPPLTPSVQPLTPPSPAAH